MTARGKRQQDGIAAARARTMATPLVATAVITATVAPVEIRYAAIQAWHGVESLDLMRTLTKSRQDSERCAEYRNRVDAKLILKGDAPLYGRVIRLEIREVPEVA